MRRNLGSLLCASTLALAAGSAAAETYTLLEGSLRDATGAAQPLTGTLELSRSEVQASPPDPGLRFLLAEDFSLDAGEAAFDPAVPLEYQGRGPLFDLLIGDQIHIEDDAVTFLMLRAGGEIVAANGDEVTFRVFEFRADASDGGRAAGELGGTGLPRRLTLAGRLFEVEKSYRLPDPSECLPSIPLPGGGGAVITTSNVFHSFQTFDLEASGTVELQQPAGGAVFTRVNAGEPIQIEGDLRADGSVYLLNPAGVAFDSTYAVHPLDVENDSTPAPVTPTLEELGMRAPGGAVVTFDATGVLTVDATGDLFVEGVFPEISGLTRLVLRATGSITISGTLHVPPGVPIEVWNGVVEPNPPVPLPGYCTALRRIDEVERELGRFTLVATAAQPVEIDVLPGSERNRVHPGSPQRLPVALLGSQQLDVRDVDPGSLRLGIGEAEPVRWHRRMQTLRLHLNRDGHADLLAFFELRDAEVAFGDTQLCLVAETHDGVALEGCDAIDARPRALHPAPAAGAPGLRTLRGRLRR